MFTTHPVFKHFVANIENLNLANENTDLASCVDKLKQLLVTYRVLVIKNQGILSEQKLIGIASSFGEIDYRGFDQHEKSPHPLILRVSNEKEHGYTDIGRMGFHIDGGYLPQPNEYSFYHIIKPSSKGGTVFLPCREVYEQLSEERKENWNRLSIVRTYKSSKRYKDKPGYVVHPLVYNHPISGDKTLYVGQGKVSRFVWDLGTDDEETCSKEESQLLEEEVENELKRHEQSLWYHHEYKEGDLVITDNLAVCHWAHPDTQLPQEEIGLRIMHRVVTKGRYTPLDYRIKRSTPV